MILLVEQSEINQEDKDRLISLADRTTLDEDQKKFLQIKINRCETMNEYLEIEMNLYLNIIEDKDRISMGFSYNATDIKKMLKQLK